MTVIIIGLLIVAGFIFLAIEIFLIPGFSVPGLVGLAMVGYGIFRAHSAYGASGALITIAVSAVAAVILIRGALRSRTVNSFGLAYSEKEAKAVNDYSSLVGKEGKALSKLRPSGIALIDGRRLDVVTDGEYIEKDSPIRVSDVEGTRIVVTPVEKDNTTSREGSGNIQ
jgi:membrane-bound serine protease (ClpP class)